MEAVVKTIRINATELRQVRIGVTILLRCIFLGLTELILGNLDLFFFVLKDLPQHLHLLL